MCIVDGLEITGGNIQGDGVFFYNTGQGLKNVEIGGNATVNITALTSGTYNNVLFFNNRIMPSTNPNDGKIIGTSTSTFERVMNVPSVHLDWGGNADSNLQTYS